jgi:hypothetical protein
MTNNWISHKTVNSSFHLYSSYNNVFIKSILKLNKLIILKSLINNVNVEVKIIVFIDALIKK